MKNRTARLYVLEAASGNTDEQTKEKQSNVILRSRRFHTYSLIATRYTSYAPTAKFTSNTLKLFCY